MKNNLGNILANVNWATIPEGNIFITPGMLLVQDLPEVCLAFYNDIINPCSMSREREACMHMLLSYCNCADFSNILELFDTNVSSISSSAILITDARHGLLDSIRTKLHDSLIRTPQELFTNDTYIKELSELKDYVNNKHGGILRAGALVLAYAINMLDKLNKG